MERLFLNFLFFAIGATIGASLSIYIIDISVYNEQALLSSLALVSLALQLVGLTRRIKNERLRKIRWIRVEI